MKLAVARAALVAALAFAITRPVPVGAQWFKYPMTGVPRTATGALDTNAPAPRGADGKPDFSGVWLGDDPLPCPPLMRDGNDCIEKIPLPRQAANIAFGLADPPFQPWAAELVRQRSATDTRDDPHAKCLPSYVPRNYTLPHYQKIFQSRGVLLMLNEFNASYRQIFMDGRPLPVDPQPSWNGYSTARWDGDALVVETSGFRDDLWMDMRGTPLTSAATLTERLTRPTFGRLNVELTIDDPKAYLRPWTVRLSQSFAADMELVEEICLEGLKPMR
jgi:hypothetical protein